MIHKMNSLILYRTVPLNSRSKSLYTRTYPPPPINEARKPGPKLVPFLEIYQTADQTKQFHQLADPNIQKKFETVVICVTGDLMRIRI